MSDPVPGEIKIHEPSCPSQRAKGREVEEEFVHTVKRLNRKKIMPLVQFCVFSYACNDKVHGDAVGSYHIDVSSLGSSVEVQGGLQAAIAGTEMLLAALKAKLQ